MGRKSSRKTFVDIICSLYDNSSSTYYYLVFDFIDSLNLQSQFEEFIIESLREEVENRGTTDGELRSNHDKVIKKIPQLFNIYHKAYLVARRS